MSSRCIVTILCTRKLYRRFGIPLSVRISRFVGASRRDVSLGTCRDIGAVRYGRSYHTTRPFSLSSNSDSNKDSMVLYDSLSESYKTLPATTDNKGLGFYTCGPTTYAPAHLGHARTYVCLDILRRVLEHRHSNTSNPPPLFVMNITDVDDKILTAAKEAGETPLTLARRYEDEFWQDWDALGCLRPHVVTRVTDHVETDIVPYIERLVQHDMAYVVDGDGVYFDVRAFESKMGHLTKYGKLAPSSKSSDLFSIQGLEETKKRDMRDFVLWKNRKPGEGLHWDSPWGAGRPGWHIECSAMIESVRKQFQNTHEFQIHAGGVDLKFPHHTNEIAQAEAFYMDSLQASDSGGKEWIPHWIHTGHLHIHGMKMSKSLKNFITIQEMLSEDGGLSEGNILSSPADDFRLWCLGLSGSYRGPATYSTDRLDEARVIRERIVRFLIDGGMWIQQADNDATKLWNNDDHSLFTLVLEASRNCHDAMVGSTSSTDFTPTRDFDMDGSRFLDELLRIVDACNTRLKSGYVGPVEAVRAAVDAVRSLLCLVGFSDATVRVGLDLEQNRNQMTRHVVGGELALIEELVRFRSAARKAALSDIRSRTATDSVKDILKICDDARTEVFPSMGLELLDDKVDDDSSSASGWRFIAPRTKNLSKRSLESSEEREKNKAIRVRDIPLQELFRSGPYEGMFSEYDDDGIPVRNADGSEVSKTLLKKLLKKRDKHIRRQVDASQSNK